MPAWLELDTHKPSGQVCFFSPFAVYLYTTIHMQGWLCDTCDTLFPAGVKLTLSGLIDGKNVNGGGHKVGMGFELEA